MKSKIIALFIVLCSFQANAQDPIFTQYYLVPETLNPAFTGIANTWNAGLVHRRQWPDGNRKIDTQYAYLNTIGACDSDSKQALVGKILILETSSSKIKLIPIPAPSHPILPILE